MSKQSTSHLFMIEPESFYSNEQTSYTNHYQEEASDEDIGEINRKIRRKNLKNNCLYSILTLCFSLHGFVTIQTTIKHIAPIIAILIHIYCLDHINFSQIQTFYFHRQEYY